MTPTTFKSLREGLGLTSAEVAQHLDVDVRTAQRWESTHPPSLDAVRWIQVLVEKFSDTKEMTLEKFYEMVATQGNPDVVPLVRYQSRESYVRVHGDEGFPYAVHNALISTLAVEIASQGFDVEVTYAPQEN